MVLRFGWFELIRLKKMRLTGCMLFIAATIILSACNSQKKEILERIEQMQSSKITIPYEKMECWTSDSLKSVASWKHAKLRLVHYVDSASCSSCLLQKVAKYDILFRMETLSDNEFYNVFIATPKGKAKKKLQNEFEDGRIPRTVFVDTADVFMQVNPNIPPEAMLHTFLLDENDSIILVGDPLRGQEIEDMVVAVVEKRLGRKFQHLK